MFLPFELHNTAKVKDNEPPCKLLFALTQHSARLKRYAGYFYKGFVSDLIVADCQMKILEWFRQKWKFAVVVVINEILFVIFCA